MVYLLCNPILITSSLRLPSLDVHCKEACIQIQVWHGEGWAVKKASLFACMSINLYAWHWLHFNYLYLILSCNGANSKGWFKEGDYMEVTFSGDEVHETCVDKVIDALGWEYNPDDGSPYLCCLSGSRIIDKPIDNGYIM